MVSTEVNTEQNTINVDWERFGLGDNTQRNNATERSRGQGTSQRTYDTEYQFGPGGHQASNANELFAEEQGDKPWWKSNFFISEPVLFGQWDGVFTSCLINIFGVIVFLRSGWIVAQAGVLNAVLIVLATVAVALVSVLSAVGICERCRMESGGVYFLVAHVLGSQYGGALGLLYVFGQAVGCALNVLGFGESIAGLFSLTDTPWATRGFASAAVLLLGIINVAGVKWVVKLQFLLLIILLLAGLDFAVGSFVHTDAASGFTGWMTGRLTDNTFPDYHDGYSWFTVFGVFFPTVTGVMAGINMSGDLRYPSRDIPNGTLAAMGTGTLLYLIFVLFLGSTCQRYVLLTDFMIASKVSVVSVLLLAGLYVSSMSSCLGAMYGTPRVLQSVANENVIPIIQILGRGRGPNKVPLYSLAVVAVVTLTFILVGQINTLAPVVTMPFLITYASIDYAYFALAQTHDIHQRREDRFRAQEFITGSSDGVRHYGGTIERSEDQFSSGDLDTLFPERLQHRKEMILQRSSSLVSSPEEQTTSQAGNHQPAVQNAHIHSKLKNWYSPFCNRWLSLGGVAVKILIMFLVHWGYALANIIAVFLVWFYIGHANPAVKPGISSEFKFFRWLKNVLLRCMGRRVQEYEQIIVTPVHPGMETLSSQINEDNEDFANRRRYHQTSTVQGRFVEIDDDD
ncbi:solute carrier family 12 member 8 isoform X1 [Schistocerca americana]|uniref:solute carrier family 12 member 8 n=1 Tax=Schistocerca piceifrons TaxID=274613 RepID=UPI001F4FB00A|nr:solute carrier family 12 member 8 isoform X1 [Schistocerca americana]XP_046999280.1 solute carrier family 12 member 8 isoform X1 [Schistocerca americana]XP_046999289.1 solute carrier family 12 member 8 isoform X1 [Schistocerca americana]XP_046999297.1 solute carrier family 12 member 8 isoform X1 [Schistocerca americana]XP_047099852.1 solute carrier family 12 member 8 [Schistocerca piceifrons]XP_047099861.1 solute carrier family 12 member 8 [Schistocerca piceifrons]XP_047099869.1 solute car